MARIVPSGAKATAKGNAPARLPRRASVGSEFVGMMARLISAGTPSSAFLCHYGEEVKARATRLALQTNFGSTTKDSPEGSFLPCDLKDTLVDVILYHVRNGYQRLLIAAFASLNEGRFLIRLAETANDRFVGGNATLVAYPL